MPPRVLSQSFSVFNLTFFSADLGFLTKKSWHICRNYYLIHAQRVVLRARLCRRSPVQSVVCWISWGISILAYLPNSIFSSISLFILSKISEMLFCASSFRVSIGFNSAEFCGLAPACSPFLTCWFSLACFAAELVLRAFQGGRCVGGGAVFSFFYGSEIRAATFLYPAACLGPLVPWQVFSRGRPARAWVYRGVWCSFSVP